MTEHFAVRNWEILAVAVIGLIVVWLVIKRPKMFWPLLIISNILGMGPSLMNYFFWDKVLSIFIIIGAAMHISLRSFSTNPIGGHSSDRDIPLPAEASICKNANHKTDSNISGRAYIRDDHKFIFGIWIVYMILESFTGVIANSDPNIFFWVMFYAMLGVLSYIIYKWERVFPFPSIRQFVIIVLSAVTIYNLLYLAYGIIAEAILDMGPQGRFVAQFLLKKTFVWTGAAMASFPTIIGMTTAIFAMKDTSIKIRILAWVSISGMMATGFYWASRAAWVTVFGILLISFRKIKIYKVGMVLFIFALFYTILAQGAPISGFFQELVDTTQLLWSAKGGDKARQLQFEATFLRLTDNAVTFFVGDGMYSHKITMIPSIQYLYDKYLPTQTMVTGQAEHRDDQSGPLTVFRTTAFTAMLIDTGVIGMTLLALLFLIVAYKIFREKHSYRIVLLAALFLTFVWQFSINTSGTALFYLTFMPSGLIDQINNQLRPALCEEKL